MSKMTQEAVRPTFTFPTTLEMLPRGVDDYTIHSPDIRGYGQRAADITFAVRKSDLQVFVVYPHHIRRINMMKREDRSRLAKLLFIKVKEIEAAAKTLDQFERNQNKSSELEHARIVAHRAGYRLVKTP